MFVPGSITTSLPTKNKRQKSLGKSERSVNFGG